MKKFNPMLIIPHVKELWNRDIDLQGDGNVVSQEDLNEATADPVEDGDTLKEAVLKLHKKIDELESTITNNKEAITDLQNQVAALTAEE